MTCPEIPFVVPLKPCPACGTGGDNCNPEEPTPTPEPILDNEDTLIEYFDSCTDIVPDYDDCQPKPTPEPTDFDYSPQPGEPGFPEPDPRSPEDPTYPGRPTPDELGCSPGYYVRPVFEYTVRNDNRTPVNLSTYQSIGHPSFSWDDRCYGCSSSQEDVDCIDYVRKRILHLNYKNPANCDTYTLRTAYIDRVEPCSQDPANAIAVPELWSVRHIGWCCHPYAFDDDPYREGPLELMGPGEGNSSEAIAKSDKFYSDKGL